MTVEEMQLQRVNTIAVMAAILCGDDGGHANPMMYAKIASDLYRAVEVRESDLPEIQLHA